MFMIQQIPLPEIVICVIKQMLYSYYKLKKKSFDVYKNMPTIFSKVPELRGIAKQMLIFPFFLFSCLIFLRLSVA